MRSQSIDDGLSGATVDVGSDIFLGIPDVDPLLPGPGTALIVSSVSAHARSGRSVTSVDSTVFGCRPSDAG